MTLSGNSEFDCCECGVRVIAYDAHARPEPPLCPLCLMLPGWMRFADLRLILAGGRDPAWHAKFHNEGS
jgi:hypothetical protein